MFALPVHSKNERCEFRSQKSQADGLLMCLRGRMLSKHGSHRCGAYTLQSGGRASGVCYSFFLGWRITLNMARASEDLCLSGRSVS